MGLTCQVHLVWFDYEKKRWQIRIVRMLDNYHVKRWITLTKTKLGNINGKYT